MVARTAVADALPNLWLDSDVQARATARPDGSYDLSIGVKNTGSAKNADVQPNRVVLRLNCQPLDGGACSTLQTHLLIAPVAPDKSLTLNLRSVCKPSRPGRYRLSITLDPPPRAEGPADRRLKPSSSVDFAVADTKAGSIRPAPALRRPVPAVQPGAKPGSPPAPAGKTQAPEDGGVRPAPTLRPLPAP
jgi:hypothetical protein